MLRERPDQRARRARALPDHDVLARLQRGGERLVHTESDGGAHRAALRTSTSVNSGMTSSPKRRIELEHLVLRDRPELRAA